MPSQILIKGMDEADHEARGGAILFCNEAGLIKKVAFDELVKRAASETAGRPMLELCILIRARIQEGSGSINTLLKDLGPCLFNPKKANFELVNMFFELDQEDAFKLAWQAMLLYPDDQMDILFRVADMHNVVLDSGGEDEFIKMLSELVNARLNDMPIFINTLFNSAIPRIYDIEKLANLLTPDTGNRLLEFGEPSRSIHTSHYILGYHYLKATLTGSLLKAVVGNEEFKYFILAGKQLESVGRFNGYAIGVLDRVPESLRPVVAYHEHVESITDSHKQAVEAEKIAVRELGVEKEYSEWISSNGIRGR